MSLIETLVAIVSGVVVMLALFTVLEVSVKQSQRLADATEATQLGRVAMDHIVEELHSVCLSEGFAPVQEKSNENELIVVNGYSNSEDGEVANVGTASTGVREDKIIYSSTAKTLLDKTYYATGTSGANAYTFSETASPANGVVLAEHVTRMTEGEKAVPVFRYYTYGSGASTSTTSASSELHETTLVSGENKLEAAAKTVAAVDVSFIAGPRDESSVGFGPPKGRRAPLTSLTTFAFEAPNDEGPKDAPCQ